MQQRTLPFTYRSLALASCLVLAGLCLLTTHARAGTANAADSTINKASWFPDTPDVPHFRWEQRPCPSCTELAPTDNWRKMVGLAGLHGIRFLLAPNDRAGMAYAIPPATIVLSPTAMKLSGCALNFVVGHELTHLALRHYDQDVVTLASLSHQTVTPGSSGDDVIQILDSDFHLALKMSPYWEAEEREADWAGSLLAAQACGCSIEKGAIAFLRSAGNEGGGIAAAHETDKERIRELKPFIPSAHILADSSH